VSHREIDKLATVANLDEPAIRTMVGQIEGVDDSRGKACSAEFMRRLEKMVEANNGKHKDLVKFIAGQTCLDPHTIRQLVRSLELKAKVSVNGRLTEELQPTVLVEALAAPNPEELATQALEEGWTETQARYERKGVVCVIFAIVQRINFSLSSLASFYSFPCAVLQGIKSTVPFFFDNPLPS